MQNAVSIFFKILLGIFLLCIVLEITLDFFKHKAIVDRDKKERKDK